MSLTCVRCLIDECLICDEVPNSYDPVLQEIASLMLKRDVEARPRADTLLLKLIEHPYFDQEENTELKH